MFSRSLINSGFDDTAPKYWERSYTSQRCQHYLKNNQFYSTTKKEKEKEKILNNGNHNDRILFGVNYKLFL